MTLYKNKDNFAGVSEKVGAIFSKLGLTPNQWTFLSVIVVLIAGWFLINHNFFLGAVFVAISVFLDVVDGAVARHTKTASSRGAYIDTIVDRYVEAIIIFALLFITLPETRSSDTGHLNLIFKSCLRAAASSTISFT